MLQVLFVGLVLAQSPAPRQVGMPIGTGTTLPKITISAPAGGWSVNRMLLVEGTLSDPTIDPVTVSINGDRYLLRTFNGRFSRKFPAASGKNVVTVMATNAAGTATAQVTSFAKVPPVPLKAVLTSDTDGVYTDLHIYEPTPGSESGELQVQNLAHVYWANTESPSGGTFYLNEQGGDFDQPGYGPYLYVHRAPPRGVYAITANYWPSGDKAHTVGTLNLTLFESTPSEIKRTVKVPLATPGTTRVLAFVNVLEAGRALIYVPGNDPRPTDPRWPKNLDAAARALVSGGGASEY
ncbi:MAG: DUF2135 domain-containing protein [Myxococcales bacterium]